MYLSHPVRRMRDDPHPDTAVDLVVTAADDAEREDLVAALEAVGAEVEERLRFGALRVACAESTVADICALDGIAEVETWATRDFTGGDSEARSASEQSSGSRPRDAGEDV